MPNLLLPLVKKERKRMEDMGVIQKVEQAIEQCFPMIVSWKKNDVHVYVHYGHPNQHIIWERVLKSTVD